MATKQRYAYFAYPTVQGVTPSQFQHGVIDTKSGRPAATLETKDLCELVAKYMNQADEAVRKDVAPYIQVIDGLSKLMVHTMLVPNQVSPATPPPGVTDVIPPPPGEV